MRKIFILAKTLLKSGGLLPGKKGGRSKWALAALLVFAFGSFAFSIGIMTLGLYDALAPFGMADMILPLAIGATSAVIFFFGIFYVVSTMYHAEDVSLLLYLPLKPYQILGAKFITLVVYEYIFELFILAPMLVVYGIKSAAGAAFIIYSLVLVAVIPVIALTMASVIIMVIMRFSSFGKNKEAFNFVSGIIAIAVAIGFNVLMQTSIQGLVKNPGSLTSLGPILSNIFPGTIFAANALIFSNELSGLFNLLLFLLCSAAAVAVFLGLGQLLYFKGVAGVTETSAKRKEISEAELAKKTERTPVVWSYTKKELRQIFRSPIAFMNCVLINFIWPVLLVIMLFSRGESMTAVSAAVSQMDAGIMLAIIVGAGVFISSSNAVTSTAFSREGKSLYIMKYIPMSMKKQLAAKTLSGILLSAIGVVLLCVAAVIIGASPLVAVLALVLCIAATVVSSIAGLLIDAAHPKLEWSNEQQAIKQNMNVLLHMLAGVVIALAIILPAALMPLSFMVVVLYIVIFIALLSVVLVRGADSAAKRFCRRDI